MNLRVTPLCAVARQMGSFMIRTKAGDNYRLAPQRTGGKTPGRYR